MKVFRQTETGILALQNFSFIFHPLKSSALRCNFVVNLLDNLLPDWIILLVTLLVTLRSFQYARHAAQSQQNRD